MIKNFPDVLNQNKLNLFYTESINKKSSHCTDEIQTKEYLSDQEIQKEILSADTSGISFAANLLEKLFCINELQGWNVYGKGKKELAKKPLNPQKIEYI